MAGTGLEYLNFCKYVGTRWGCLLNIPESQPRRDKSRALTGLVWHVDSGFIQDCGPPLHLCNSLGKGNFCQVDEGFQCATIHTCHVSVL